ncbi:restriction endonuclease [Saccharothrix sp. ST-888]|uniref:restriction endonuclease n=1 Tax=Saccharothrix sp. ST-888 TaxID=1427391 RepID=UPI000697621F|nr:restriction endonuclease [Saccharothrix sp. ST-888]
MGAQIAVADHAALLATWLWNEEGYFLLDAHDALNEHHRTVEALLQDALRRKQAEGYGLGPHYGPVPAAVAEGIQAAELKLMVSLREAKTSGRQAADLAERLWNERGTLFGYDVRDQYQRDSRSSQWTRRLEGVADLYFGLPRAREQLRQILREHCDAVHAVALAEAARQAHLDSAMGISTEGRYLRSIYDALRLHWSTVVSEVDDASRRAAARFRCPAGDQVPSETVEAFDTATKALRTSLFEEREQADLAVRECSELWSGAASAFGLIPGTDSSAPSHGPATMEAVAGLSYRLYAAQVRLAELLTNHAIACQGITLTEDRRIGYVRSGAGTKWWDLTRMHHRDFEDLVATLFERDGFTIIQRRGGPGDLGADVIAVSPSGQRCVVQCKLSSKLHKVDTGALQRFNGTAKPQHGADVAILVTNAGFTKPALRFARAHSIKLMGGWEVQRWAQWGIPAPQLLHLP